LYQVNMLPELPKKNKKREAHFGISFRHWLEQHPPVHDNETYELKDTRGSETFRLAEIKDKQLNYAIAIESPQGVLIRIKGTNGEPDYTYMRNGHAYFVIQYPKGFCILSTSTIINVKRKQKTISYAEARLRDVRRC
jgi:hypothetical protein